MKLNFRVRLRIGRKLDLTKCIFKFSTQLNGHYRLLTVCSEDIDDKSSCKFAYTYPDLMELKGITFTIGTTVDLKTRSTSRLTNYSSPKGFINKLNKLLKDGQFFYRGH